MNKLDHRFNPKLNVHPHANPHFAAMQPMRAPELEDIHGAFGDSDAEDPVPTMASPADDAAIPLSSASPAHHHLHFDAVYWRSVMPQRHYVLLDRDFERDYEPAYRFGHEQRQLHPAHSRFEDVEHTLQARWSQLKVQSRLSWQEASDAVKEAWLRISS